jgi:hypothetical protein
MLLAVDDTACNFNLEEYLCKLKGIQEAYSHNLSWTSQPGDWKCMWEPEPTNGDDCALSFQHISFLKKETKNENKERISGITRFSQVFSACLSLNVSSHFKVRVR